MSIKVMAEVMEGGVAGTAEFAVLLVLANFADETGYCYPSMQTIARLARMSERGARKVVRRLEDQGFLACDIGGGRGGATRYRITANPEPRSPNKAEKGEQHSRNRSDKGGTAFPEYGSPGNVVPQKGGTRVHKRGNPVPPNRQEPSIEPSKTLSREDQTPLSEKLRRRSGPPPEMPFETPSRDAALDRFPEFWAVYPLKENRSDAEGAWVVATLHADPDRIIDAARAYAAAKASTERRYLTQPTNWLAKKRWTDELQPDTTPKSAKAERWAKIARRTA